MKAASRYSARDNKDMIALSKLKTLKTVLVTQGESAAEQVAESMPPDAPTSAPPDE